MKLVPIFNAGETMLYISGVMIPSGETKHLPENQVPKHLKNKQGTRKQEKPTEDEIIILLAGTVPDIIKAMRELSDGDYARLKASEFGGKSRKTLLDAFAEEDLRRASMKAAGAEETA